MAKLTDSILYPFVPDGIAAERATSIVHGVLVSTADDRAELSVDSVRRGDQTIDGTTIAVRCGAWEPDVGTEGWFFLDAAWDEAVLLMIRDRREMERVVGGLPRSDPRILPEQLRELFESSDAVVIGLAVPTSTSTAVIDVAESRKGDLVGEVSVTRGFETDEPGGPWEFDMSLTGEFPGPSGIYFLAQTAEGWSVLNPSDPRVLSPYELDEALGID